MSRLIIDIETAGKDFDSLDKHTQDYLLKWAETEEEIKDIKESLALYPLTGEIIVIGLFDPDLDKGAVYFQSPEILSFPFEKDGVKFEPGTEKEILEKFWDKVKKYSEIVTFNGRAFDCPFILVRSAKHKIRPTKELMPNRYNGSHIDLLDQLAFYGASRRKFSLDMWCRTFGIKSPKEDGITGAEVKNLFAEKKYIDIAKYCLGDLKATKDLLYYWENFIKLNP
ncbi:MAG: ribonuclease H-like domain-containing protein [Nitrospiraceae bacterium]|nr:ribonuclease H-like domain-containing protein [Nitrospiraceae bacterium]